MIKRGGLHPFLKIQPHGSPDRGDTCPRSSQSSVPVRRRQNRRTGEAAMQVHPDARNSRRSSAAVTSHRVNAGLEYLVAAGCGHRRAAQQGTAARGQTPRISSSSSSSAARSRCTVGSENSRRVSSRRSKVSSGETADRGRISASVPATRMRRNSPLLRASALIASSTGTAPQGHHIDRADLQVGRAAHLAHGDRHCRSGRGRGFRRGSAHRKWCGGSVRRRASWRCEGPEPWGSLVRHGPADRPFGAAPATAGFRRARMGAKARGNGGVPCRICRGS